MIDLKSATQNLHNEVEQCYYPKQLFLGKITKEEYITYLQIFYGLHYAIEKAFEKFDTKWSSYHFPYQEYLRLDLLEQDLQNLLQNNDKKFLLEDFTFYSFEEAIGFLYVLTGSTMGGMLLSAKVENNPHLKEYPSINNYFLGFKEDTHKMWGRFMGFLEKYTNENPTKNDLIIDGAKRCFDIIIKGLQNEK